MDKLTKEQLVVWGSPVLLGNVFLWFIFHLPLEYKVPVTIFSVIFLLIMVPRGYRERKPDGL